MGGMCQQFFSVRFSFRGTPGAKWYGLNGEQSKNESFPIGDDRKLIPYSNTFLRVGRPLEYQICPSQLTNQPVHKNQ
jgi:hypothetical protein